MPAKPVIPDSPTLLADLVARAKIAGADAADAMLVDAAALSVGCRLGKVETLERAESGVLDLRVFIGKKQAIASTTDRRPRALEELVARTVAMAKAAPEDEYCGLAAPGDIAKSWPALEMADDHMPDAEHLIKQTRIAEDAARAVKGVTNSEGADAGASTAEITLVASNGFTGRHRRTHYSLSATMLAGDGTGMERDYDFASRVFARDLPDAASIGKSAGERATRKLGARKMKTAAVPVVFDPRIAGSILGHLSSAISGAAIARGTSFLKDGLGQKIFADSITVTDDPHRARGLRSFPFDGEGLLPQRRKIIDRGTLTTWLLDQRSARQLKMKSTAHASRSPGSLPSPSPSNLYLEAGTMTPAELMRDIKQGFYVTELMGYGVNGVTGDYSRAAAGFWIENGTVVFPVSEMTIAGNLKDMFLQLTPANDLQFLYGIDAPTLRLEGMTVAGVERMLSYAYRKLTDLGAPLIGLYLLKRRAEGREDKTRFPERLGHASRPRPVGRLVWCHAASVGEAASVLALIGKLRELYPETHILATTGTVTSARMLEGRLSEGVIHQYIPVDRARYVARFLDHWKPDFAILIESELWPNILNALRLRMIPAALVNGRMSDRSFRRWYRVKGWAKELLSTFVICLAQTEDDRGRFVALGAKPARCFGNLKYAANPLPADETELARLRGEIGERPVWLLASSHRGEEEIACSAHKKVREIRPGLLTIIVPRHAVRGREVAETIKRHGLAFAQRSKNENITTQTEIYLADTMGELGSFYRLSRVALIGGSFTGAGGHNPVEAAQLDCSIFFGPHMHNFSVMAKEFVRERAALQLRNADEIPATVHRLLGVPEERRNYAAAALRLAGEKRHVLDEVLQALAPWLDTDAKKAA